jgi:hypothetical protein
MNQEEDQLLHLYWKERKTQASHEEVKIQEWQKGARY